MMKIVQSVEPRVMLSIEEISKHAYFGVCMQTGSSDREYDEREHTRGFITKRSYDDGPFTIMCPFEVTNGNGWDSWDHINLKSLIYNLIRDEKEVFQFDSFHEMFAWVLEKKN